MFKLEGMISSRECYFGFLNRSVPVFPKEKNNIKTKRTDISKDRGPIFR